jgi:hypothetical protein
MVVLAALIIALLLVGLVSLVIDTVRIANQIGGYPPVELTHRAYGA